jgi:hypothetical protein
VAKSESRPLLLIARRHAQSLVACRALGATAEITWSYQDLGLEPGQPFTLGNPLVAEPSS